MENNQHNFLKNLENKVMFWGYLKKNVLFCSFRQKENLGSRSAEPRFLNEVP